MLPLPPPPNALLLLIERRLREKDSHIKIKKG
jgi:hypothetical protein